MYVGIELKHNEVRWGTLYQGKFCSFPPSPVPGGLTELFSKQEACGRFIRNLLDEISRQIGDCKTICIAAPALDVQEYAVLKAAIAADNRIWSTRILHPAAAAAFASCYQQPKPEETDGLIVITADKDRYNLCVAENGDGVCEILGSVPMRKPGLSADDILRTIYAMCDQIEPRPEPFRPGRVLVAQTVPDQVFSLIRQRLQLPCRRFDGDLSLLGAVLSAGKQYGERALNPYLLLNTFDYRIKIRSETLLKPGLTIPTSRVLTVPSSAVRNQNLCLSFSSDDMLASDVYVYVPVPSLPSDQQLTVAVSVDVDGDPGIRLSAPASKLLAQYDWPVIRAKLCIAPRPIPAKPGNKPLRNAPKKTPDRPLPAAEDDGPYLFISYAHKNKDRVLPIIRRLQQDGYRVWYDKEIHPGAEWPETIASRVEQCAVFLPFMTKEYLASENCKRELHFAGDINKTRTLIFLEKVELTSGMKLQHGLQQAILAYVFSDPEELYRRLYTAEGIEAARK